MKKYIFKPSNSIFLVLFLQVEKFPTMGRGVITEKELNTGDFVVEYKGNLISRDEALEKEEAGDGPSYLYFITFQGKEYW